MDAGKKITGYEILKGNSPSRLQTLVNAYLEKGWVPLGGPFCDAVGEIYQTLIFQS